METWTELAYFHQNSYRQSNEQDINYSTRVIFCADNTVTLINDTRGNDDRSDACFWGEVKTYSGTYTGDAKGASEGTFEGFTATFSVSGNTCTVKATNDCLKYTVLDGIRTSVPG